MADIPNRKVLTTTTGEDGKFLFIEMPKLKFQIQIDLLHFCWEKEKLRITVDKTRVSEQDFFQTGYKVTYQSTEKFDALLTQKGSKSGYEIKILYGGKGQRSFCLEKSGIWELYTQNECFKLDQDV